MRNEREYIFRRGLYNGFLLAGILFVFLHWKANEVWNETVKNSPLEEQLNKAQLDLSALQKEYPTSASYERRIEIRKEIEEKGTFIVEVKKDILDSMDLPPGFRGHGYGFPTLEWWTTDNPVILASVFLVTGAFGYIPGRTSSPANSQVKVE